MTSLLCSNLSLGYFTFRLDEFSPLSALGLFALLGGFTIFLGLRSLAGLGPVRKWVAIGTRLAVILLLILILGDIKLIRKNSDVEIMVVRDISQSTSLVTDYPGKYLQSSLDDYLINATSRANSPSRRDGDRIGQISFNEHAFLDLIPSPVLSFDSRAVRGPGTGTDAAGALQLGLASMGNNSMHRMLLIWDGNATSGDLNAALAAASSQHVPIDVMPLQYNVEHEVMMDKFIAPTRRQEGQPFDLDIYLNNKNDDNVVGDLSVTDNGKLIALHDGKTTERITLRPGPNVERVQMPAQAVGMHQFHATISDIDNVDVSTGSTPAASQLDNKSADAFTFVQGKGRVLLVDNTDPSHTVDSAKFLRQALTNEKIDFDSIAPEQFPNNPIELQAYDAVILANVPRGDGGLNDAQETMLAQYIHDTGGGLVMIGGPQTYGAGGWEGSRLEQELPVNMEVPAQRQIPKGALVLVMDPAEAPDGNYWGEECALKAMEALSSQDEVGVISYNFSNGNGDRWDAYLEPKGDGSRVANAIKTWELGDMPSFEDSITLALNGESGHPGLLASNARAKHIVIITDDDPQMPFPETIQKMIDNKISVSTITVYPHNPGNVAAGIRELAKQTGGKNYGPFEGNLAPLPQIFIKEASVVKRSIIQEDPKGIPVRLAASSSELVKGITPGNMPPLYGYDLTGRKDNPLVEVPMVAGPKRDPVLATWQAGLGKTVAYMGDAFNRWDANWVGSDLYEKFWSQLVRGVSRSPFSSDFETEVTTDGEKGHIIIRATKEGNAFNNFLNITGVVEGGGDMTAHPIRPLQTGPGTYEADFDAAAQGNYICYLQYAGQDGKSGSLFAGTTVNSSPEMRNLQSNDALLQQIAERTGGRYLKPFDVSSADLFTRDGLAETESPQSIWDLLVPWLLALIIIDVAVRRIAWDWPATRKMALAVADYVRTFTMSYRRVESPRMLDSLKRVRDEVAEQKFKTESELVRPLAPMAAGARPDPRAKFQAGDGVEGELASIVGGAIDKPIPSAPQRVEPKGAVGLGEHTSGLLKAKQRAQQKIKQQQED